MNFRTDWDVFAEEGKAPARGDKAVSSWTRFDLDLKALRQLGVSHFRFGVEWARIEPKPGVINEQALARYVGMARQLRAAGMERREAILRGNRDRLRPILRGKERTRSDRALDDHAARTPRCLIYFPFQLSASLQAAL
jgi:hypothetical protein